MTTYTTHDNGGRPFSVTIQDDGSVSLQMTRSNLEKVFIGRSLLCEFTSKINTYGHKYDGNSILMHMKGNNYIFIGCKVFHFEARAPIVEYVSHVGRNDVPYPYAIDEEGRYYLMLENVTLEKVPPNTSDDPYSWYYYNATITEDYTPPLRYTSDPHKDYKFFTEYISPSASVTLKNGETIQLDEEKYAEIINNYGDRMGFKFLPTETLIVREWYR